MPDQHPRFRPVLLWAGRGPGRIPGGARAGGTGGAPRDARVLGERLAQAAAVASLAAEPELAQRVEWVASERTRARDELLAQGWTVPDSQANFVWLRLGTGTLGFASACEQAGVRVRAYDGEGARVSIGGKEANDMFLAAAKTYLARP